MLVVLGMLLIALLVLRVFLVERSEGDAFDVIIMNLFRRSFSLKYFLPLKYHSIDTTRIYFLKKMANLVLYIFYIGFCLLIAYGILTVPNSPLALRRVPAK